MLVLARRHGEHILIGDDITITVVRISSSLVRLGITCPRSMNIVRSELVLEVPEGASDEEIAGSIEIAEPEGD